MKLKEKFIGLFDKIKASTRSFPVTIISIMILTVIYAINIKNNFLDNDTIEKISIFILVFTSGTFLIETLAKEKSTQKIIGYIASAIIAFVFTYIIVEANSYSEIFMFRFARLFYCYIIVLITLAVYFNYRKSEIKFCKYVANVFVNTLKITLIYGIFALGIAAVLGIFIFLILDGIGGYNLILRVEILLLGGYYAPSLLYVFYKQDDVGKFGKVIIKYVLDTLVMAAFVVIYMYIIKIIILQDIPSNRIFRILTILFAVGMPIWTMTMAFDEGKIFDKINEKLPLLFVPFIILQIYSIGVRIFENGITGSRYICVMIIIFEIIYIAIYIKNKDKIGNILITFAVMAIVANIVPYINMFYISNISQYNRLKENYYNNGEEYTDEEKSNIYGAYYYLKWSSVEGYKYLENLSDDEKEEIETFKVSTSTRTDTTNIVRIYASKVIESINVDGYQNLHIVSASSSYNTSITALNNLKFEYSNDEGEEAYIRVDLYELINLYIDNEENIDEYFEENNEWQIDDGTKLILKSISIKYNTEKEIIESYSITGYLLEKQTAWIYNNSEIRE